MSLSPNAPLKLARCPHSLAASLAALPSMSLFLKAPFDLSVCPSMSLAFPQLGVGIHSTILNRRRPSQLFTRSGHWDHKRAVLLGDEISHRARRAFGVFLIDRDHQSFARLEREAHLAAQR